MIRSGYFLPLDSWQLLESGADRDVDRLLGVGLDAGDVAILKIISSVLSRLGLESRSQIKLIRLKDTFKEAAKSHLESPSSYYAIRIKM